MHALLRCDACSHGAALHSGGGCEVVRCACRLHRQQIVDEALDAEVEASHAQWHAAFERVALEPGAATR